MQSVDKVDPECLEECRVVISTLHDKFDRRFQNFTTMEREFKLLSTPFTTNVGCVREELQMEILDLQCDSLLTEKYSLKSFFQVKISSVV